MAHGIVDDLEAIEVDEQHREQFLRVAVIALQGLFHALQQQGAIGQAGQRVVQGFVLETALDALAFGNLFAQVAVGQCQGARALGDAAFQAGVGLLQRFGGVLALQRVGYVVAHEGQQLLVAHIVGVLGRIALHCQHTHRAIAPDQRHAQPAHRTRAAMGQFAQALQSLEFFGISQQWLAMAQHILGDATAVCTWQSHRVEFVDGVGEA